MERTNRNTDCVIYILLAMLLIFVWHAACGLPYNSGEAALPVSFNLLLYVAAILGTALTALIAFLLKDLIGRGVPENSSAVRFLNVILAPFFLAVGAGIFILVYIVYANENTLFPGNAGSYSLRQFFPHPVYFAAVLIPALLLYIAGKSSVRASRLLRVVTAILVSSLSALYAYCPNPFADSGAGVLHIDAYTTTIINAARLLPYDSHHISIYGHHGILYLPLVKLLGSNYRAVNYAICIFAFITFLAASYAADVLIEKGLVYALTMFTILATTTLLTRRGVYYQINPHRLLFPMLALAQLAYEAKHPGKERAPGRIFLHILISALALVWNFETGLFAAVTFALCSFMKRYYSERRFSPLLFLSVLSRIFFVVFSMALALGIIDLYNLAVGGVPVSPKHLIYPLFSGTYNVNNLRVPLPSVGHLYFLQILLFGFSLLAMLRGRTEAPEEDRPTNVFVVGIALSGLSSLIYFINRPAYGNMSIAFIQMALLAGFWVDRFMDRRKLTADGFRAYRLMRYMIGAALFFCIFWISVEGILYIEQGISLRQTNGWTVNEEKEVLDEIRKIVPEDTTAFGLAVPQLYYELGWDPQVYPMDFADINTENRDFLRESVRDVDALLTTDPDYVPEGLTLRQTFKLRGSEFMYYMKE